MTKYFTPNTTPPGFYSTIPIVDYVEITDEKWQQLIAAQYSGKQIVTDSDGMPAAVEAKAVDYKE